jgi:hypothetical protein
LSNSTDVDVYRFYVLDFGGTATVQVRSPGGMPYRVSIAIWNGDVVSTSSGQGGPQSASLSVVQPGSYYALVDSGVGAFSPSQPYTVSVDVEYPGPAPLVTLEGEFRANEGDDEEDIRANADFIQDGGSRTIRTKRSGSPEDPSVAGWEMAEVGENFTATIDARVIEGNNAGVAINFGNVDAGIRYSVLIDTTDQQARLSNIAPDEAIEIVPAFDTGAVVVGNGVNRITIQARGGTVRVFVNGTRVISVDGLQVPPGWISFGVISWEDTAAVRFDNLLVTSPSP